MLGLARYRLRNRRPDAAVFDLVDPQSGDLVGVAGPEIAEPARRGPVRTFLDSLLRSRPVEPFIKAIALVIFPFWFVGALFGLWTFHHRGPRPRLILRRPDDSGIVFTIRVSSGLMYDSRDVYDGQGGLIAEFRSNAKTTLWYGFGIVDLKGWEESGEDFDKRPRLGRVVPEGGSFRLGLVGDRDAGRITPHTGSPRDDPSGRMVGGEGDHYDIEASPSLRDDETGEILLLAAALTVAWRPPPG